MVCKARILLRSTSSHSPCSGRNHLISKKQICGEAFSKVSVGSTRGQQRKRPVEKHESGTMLRLFMRPVTFFGRRVNAVQNEEPQNRAARG